MSLDAVTALAAAVPGLLRSDLRGPGITRDRSPEGFRYFSPSGADVTQEETLRRIGALAIPPAWTNVWISPDPLGHIQATGVDSRGRTQYRYHQLWREQRDAQKFAHMLRFADALPALRTATLHDLKGRGLGRDRVAAGVVRLIDLGLFRIGGEKYAELDHHYGATTLQKRHVRVTREGIEFDYIAKEGRHRAITVKDQVVLPTVRALASSDNGLDTLFAWERAGAWHTLHSHDVGSYIAERAGAHFTAKEFRTWNATVLMALVLANAGPSPNPQSRKRVINAGIREVAAWLGDTPAVARASYIDPGLISRYESDGELPTVPVLPAALPAAAEAEIAVATLLATGTDRSLDVLLPAHIGRAHGEVGEVGVFVLRGAPGGVVAAEERGDQYAGKRHAGGTAKHARDRQHLDPVVPDRNVAVAPVYPLLDHVPAAVALPVPDTADVLPVTLPELGRIQVDLGAGHGRGAVAEAAADRMAPPHVPGAERLPVVTAACLAGRSAVQAGQLPAAPEVEARRELDVVAEIQHAGGGQGGLPRTGERRVELPAAGLGAVSAGIRGRTLAVPDPQHRAATRRGGLSHRAELGLPEAALRRIPPRALPLSPVVAGELPAPAHGRTPGRGAAARR
jgi:DNA topoisomerase IB